MKPKLAIAILCVAVCAMLAGCGGNATSTSSSPQSTQPSSTASSTTQQSQGIDYLALVNKLNALPDGWEDALETVHFTNTVGDDVEVEKKAYDAYLELKADLEKEDVHVDLDSARRSVAEQERIMADFTEKYGADYAKKTVATPGYSEHHTGLALDLYLIVDGQDVTENEDMVQYPEIWQKIHAKLAEHGFILRYLEGDEHITGYGYEPWHIRYVDDPAIAKEITEQGITFEEYKAGKVAPEVSYDFGNSSLYTREELEEAAVQAKCEFATFAGCELHSLRYAGDACNTPENLAWLNSLDEGKNYTQVCELVSDFHSPTSSTEPTAWNLDTEYTDYQWWLARTSDGGWQLLSYGY
ncbi:M15 family metallopeptidase [Denitrobacterium detoxificans]|uniref:D-alanyl-D-alanine carboxypeptidase n=1 Tax=Denitrobacterium detoxificans TaxID=79604 RepID=A0A1H8REJ8_9ACTN|nr:M15 family metallopeptidase [Denitrobacterium detoxificans]SEO64810.1 D-alanyl-D-alanine carboxypeptidase [Denitrobacterium detoxificans]